MLRKCFDPFLKEAATLGEFRDRRGKEPALKASGRGKSAYGGRILVLIDEQSGSGAEIFAAGLQELGRTLIIGRRSSGHVLAKMDYGLPGRVRQRPVDYCFEFISLGLHHFPGSGTDPHRSPVRADVRFVPYQDIPPRA